MVEPRQSALQRIQVGLVGLGVVLLFVSLANMVLDRVTEGSPASENSGVAENKTGIPDEPLAELGVTPVATEESKRAAEAPPPPSSNVGQSPEGSR